MEADDGDAVAVVMSVLGMETVEDEAAEAKSTADDAACASLRSEWVGGVGRVEEAVEGRFGGGMSLL